MDIYTWQENIAQHRKANNLPPITLAQAEDQLCKQIPPQNCEQETPADAHANVNTRLTWGSVVDGTKAYVALIASGFETVPQEEANRRGAICAGCYYKTNPQGCGACLKIARLITGTVAQKKTKHDDYLVNRACAVCACPVASLVHFPMDVLEKTDSPEKQSAYPEFCWRKKGGVNRVE